MPLPLREKEGPGWTSAYASTGCHRPSQGAHTLVFWHGGSAQEMGPGAYLCGLPCPQWECFAWSSPPTYIQLTKPLPRFSKLDVNCGFWQIPLHKHSQKLTTFGCFYFKRLPFGISSAPEYSQRRMRAILDGHQGVLCHMDDIFIFGRDHGEHDTRLNAALSSIQETGVTLNVDKCLFLQTSISSLGHTIDQNRVSTLARQEQSCRWIHPPTSRNFVGS